MVHSWVLADGLSSLLLRGLNMTVCVTLQTCGWLFLQKDFLWGGLEASIQIIIYQQLRHLSSTQSAIYFMNAISKDEDHYHNCIFNYLKKDGGSEDELAQLVPFWILYPRACYSQSPAQAQRINIFLYHSLILAYIIFIQPNITH